MPLFQVQVPLYADTATKPIRRMAPLSRRRIRALLDNGVLDDIVRAGFFTDEHVVSVSRVRYQVRTKMLVFNILTTLRPRDIEEKLRGAPLEDTSYEGENATFRYKGFEFFPDIRARQFKYKITPITNSQDELIPQRQWYK